MTEKTTPTVDEAWSAVMGDVQAVKKDSRAQAGPMNFNFRGIDAVMTAVGPALRKHGVHIRSIDVKPTYRDTSTSGGKATKEVIVMVTYRVTGPAGDYFDGMAPGEALDNGDKGTAKAMSVAYRTFLLQSLTIPTDEPDPDTYHYERAPRDWAAEIAGATSLDVLRQLWNEAGPAWHAAITARKEQLTTPAPAEESTPEPAQETLA